MPAHLTVLYPFIPAGDIDAAVVGSMRSFFASQRSEEVVFGSFSAWPGRTVWLNPESQAATDLLANTRKQWPRYLPYGRTDIEPIPHLTVGDGVSDEVEHKIRAAIEPELPIRSSLVAVDLMVFDGERWVSRHRFDLDASR